MKNLYLTFLASFICSTLLVAQENPELYSRVKVYCTDLELRDIGELGISIDHGQRKQDHWFITDLSETDINTLRSSGYNLEILIEDVSAYYVAQNLEPSAYKATEKTTCISGGASSIFPVNTPSNWQLGSMGGYYTYQEFLDELDSMASKYPDLISVKSPISTFTSIEGRPIYWVRISDNPNTDEAEEEVLYTALHHAREPASLSQLIYYMWWLLENYGTNDEVTYLVNETEMYFVPMVNPDGYIYNETTNPGGGGMHRKNRRNVGTSNKGVDLNRNYSYHWSVSGASPLANNDTYCGTAAFSEPETQAIKWFCENRDFLFASNAHTYGNLLLFPMGWATSDTAADHDYMQAFTNHMVLFNGYTAEKSSTLYPASGDSDDFMYADDLSAKPKIYSMTPECGPDAMGFWPPLSAIEDLCSENIWMNKTLAHMPHIYGVTTDKEPGQIASTSGYLHYELERLGLEDGDIIVSLETITGIQTVGSANTHTLNILDIVDDSISFTLNPGISFGDEIKYVLITDNGLWQHRDTITKTFGAGTAVFSDNCNDMTNWSGTWNFTTEDYVSPNKCITDSPFNDYQNNQVSDVQLNQSFSFENATYAYIHFMAKWAVENDYDYVEFMASIDGGLTWSPLCGKYTNSGVADQDLNQPLYDGFQTSWVLEEIDLTDYIGMTDVRFKFHLVTDGGLKEDGFYFDDFKVFTDHINDAGISESGSIGVMLFPNPVSEVLTIQFNRVDGIGQVQVFSELGQLVTTLSITGEVNHLNVAGWNEGIYYIRTTMPDGSITSTRFTVIR